MGLKRPSKRSSNFSVLQKARIGILDRPFSPDKSNLESPGLRRNSAEDNISRSSVGGLDQQIAVQSKRVKRKSYVDQDSLVDFGPIEKDTMNWMSDEIFIQQEYRQIKRDTDPNILTGSEDSQRNRSKDSQNRSHSNESKSSKLLHKVDFREIAHVGRLQAPYHH
jgi:hypothetical protein